MTSTCGKTQGLVLGPVGVGMCTSVHSWAYQRGDKKVVSPWESIPRKNVEYMEKRAWGKRELGKHKGELEQERETEVTISLLPVFFPDH